MKPKYRKNLHDQPALCVYCAHCDEVAQTRRHTKEQGDKYYAVCYDCND